MDPQSWKTSLLDLSSDRRALVALPGADPVKLALTLAGGGAFAFEAGCDPAGEGERYGFRQFRPMRVAAQA